MAAKKLPTPIPTGGAAELLDPIADESRRTDATRLCDLMREITARPTVWGGGIAGFRATHHWRGSLRASSTWGAAM
ncbi:hypothetical protein AB0D38_15150 [Streptomyces sp. NPDC048279]|uniref:hypothetical protein n=1 Tax=Streptomyces sp. NPDC048279 TaxID=3154714 RepID=UPI003425BCDA